MTVYMIAEITVTDDAWVPEYAAQVHDIVAAHGGSYLSRSGNIESLEGAENDATLIAIMSFPERAELDAFVTDPAYQPLMSARQAGSVGRFRVIDDTDIAGTIPYLAGAA